MQPIGIMLLFSATAARSAGLPQGDEAIVETMQEIPTGTPQESEPSNGGEKVGSGTVSVVQLIRELVDDFRHDLSMLPSEEISPLAVASLRVSSNLSKHAIQLLDTILTPALHRLRGVRQIQCAPCRAVRSRVVGQEWVVTHGVTSLVDARRIGAEIGVNVLLFAVLDWVEADNGGHLALTTQVIHAESGVIVFSRRYLSTSTRAARVRGGVVATTEDGREQTLKELLGQRPRYTHQLTLGTLHMPWGVMAFSSKYRLAEAFGPNFAWTYGVLLNAYMTLASDKRSIGGSVHLDVGYTMLFAKKLLPRIRLAPSLGFYSGGETTVRTTDTGEEEKVVRAALVPCLGLGVDFISRMQVGVALKADWLLRIEKDSFVIYTMGLFWLWE